MLEAYSNTENKSYIRNQGNNNALYMFIISRESKDVALWSRANGRMLVASAVAIAIQSRCFGRSAEVLSRKVRYLTFSTLLRQDIAYFDMDAHSTGTLVSNIADWAQKINVGPP